MSKTHALLVAVGVLIGGSNCAHELDDVGQQSAALTAVTWQNVVGVTPSANDLVKTGAAGWNAGASSVESISGDGAVEFSTSESTTNKMVGLSNGDSNASYAEIDFALYLRANRDIRVFENGADRGVVGTYNAGDLFRVEVTGTTVTYYKNGSLLYTSMDTPTFPLLADTSLHTTGATVDNVELGTTITTFWQNEVGVSTVGNDMAKTGGAGWNAGASTTDSLTTDGYAEFTSAEANTAKMAGLSNGDATRSYTEIDFAFYLRTNGQLQVYENGVNRGLVGTYVAGDVLRVEVNGTTVTYLKNGSLLYTSLDTPTLPLLLDTSLYTTGATIDDVAVVETPFWQNAVGVSISADDLSKTGATGWNAGASTVQTLTGDGYVEFTTAEISGYRMGGLSNGDTDAGYADIDFAFYLRKNGRLRIYEGGVDRGGVGLYAAGDILRVEVLAGVVTYRRNGALLFTSAGTPTAPLLFDSSIYTTSGTINDVTFGTLP